MTATSDKLMEKLIQITEWAVDNETPSREKLNLIPKIHEVTSAIKQEMPNLSQPEKVDLVMQLVILESIVKTEQKRIKK